MLTLRGGGGGGKKITRGELGNCQSSISQSQLTRVRYTVKNIGRDRFRCVQVCSFVVS